MKPNSLPKKLATICATAFLTLGTLSAAHAGTVTRDGNILTVTGDFDRNMWNAWSLHFTAGEITHVKLESNGGSVYWGSFIADAIYDNQDTIVTEAIGTCASMCAVAWMSADKHVYNAYGNIGFHLSYIDDIDYLDDRLKEWGIRGTEWDTKASVMRDMMDYFKIIDNKNAFGTFIEGIQENGLMGFHMWYPTDYQLKLFEGDWVEAPAYSLEEFEPEDKGFGFSVNSADAQLWHHEGGKYRSELYFSVDRSTIDEVLVYLYDEYGNQIQSGSTLNDNDYAGVRWNVNTHYTTLVYKQYSVEKPTWAKLTTNDGTSVKWIKLR